MLVVSLTYLYLNSFADKRLTSLWLFHSSYYLQSILINNNNNNRKLYRIKFREVIQLLMQFLILNVS